MDRALDALSEPYVGEHKKFMTGGIPDSWYITEVTPEARRAVGQWPTRRAWPRHLARARIRRPILSLPFNLGVRVVPSA